MTIDLSGLGVKGLLRGWFQLQTLFEKIQSLQTVSIHACVCSIKSVRKSHRKGTEGITY